MSNAVRYQRSMGGAARRSTGPVGGLPGLDVLELFEVWIDPENGSRGTIDVTVELDGGATNQGEFWELSGIADGVCVDGYTGELTVNPAAMGDPSTPNLRGFMVCDLSAISGGSTNRRIWSNKVSASTTPAGLHIDEPTADEFTPRLTVGDGSSSVNSGAHATDVAGAGRVMLFWDLFWFGTVFARMNVVTAAGAQTQVSADFSSLSSFEIPHDGMVFGAGCNSATSGPGGGPNAANGIGGATLDVYACGFDRSKNAGWETEDALLIAASYGVL